MVFQVHSSIIIITFLSAIWMPNDQLGQLSRRRLHSRNVIYYIAIPEGHRQPHKDVESLSLTEHQTAGLELDLIVTFDNNRFDNNLLGNSPLLTSPLLVFTACLHSLSSFIQKTFRVDEAI